MCRNKQSTTFKLASFKTCSLTTKKTNQYDLFKKIFHEDNTFYCKIIIANRINNL